jgi:hypothetical protein
VHFWTFPDAPGGRFAFSRPGDALSLYQEIKFNREMITGGSFSFFTGLDTTQTMARGEFAYAWDEKMFDPVKNTPFGPTTIFVPPLGYIPLPFGPQEGTYPDAGILRWVLGLDNNIWIRFLNHKNTFLVSAQVYGQHILHNWSETYRLALPIYGKTDPLSPDYYVKLHKNEYQATLMINTYYMDGDLVPQIAGDLLPPPPVPQGDCHGTLGLALTDDVCIELRYDLSRREDLRACIRTRQIPDHLHSAPPISWTTI